MIQQFWLVISIGVNLLSFAQSDANDVLFDS